MKKRLFQSSSLYLLLFLVAFGWYGCKKDDAEPTKTAPTGLTTLVATNITPTGATISGNVAANGGETLLSKGVVYSKTNTTPNLTDDVIELASGTDVGAFSVTLTGLDGSTKYYARAFATNSMGITYGSVVEFTTATAATVPTVTTTAANAITTTTAKSGGDVPDDGGAPVSEKGIYYGDMAEPGPSNGGIKIDGGSGTGSFISSITGLSPNTAYHVRAYAKNSVGTGFGADLTFTTQETGKPQVNTKPLSGLTYTGVISGGTVSDAGGSGLSINAFGIVYSTNTTPTLSNGTSVTGAPQSSDFTASITGLTSPTKIYIRAYATNSGGQTGYGQILSYTPPPATVSYQGVTYNTVIIGNQVWFKENLKARKWRDGITDIAFATSASSWNTATTSSTAAYCFDGYSSTTDGGAGAYYNFFAVVDSRKLCPLGWKVPAVTDFEELVTGLGGNSQANQKLKSTDANWWNSPGNNSSGFSALGVGTIESSGNTALQGKKEGSDIWSNTEASALGGKALRINHPTLGAIPDGGGGNKGRGNPVRCLMEQ